MKGERERKMQEGHPDDEDPASAPSSAGQGGGCRQVQAGGAPTLAHDKLF